MASNPPGECCTQGFKLEGNPTGSLIDIGSVNTYVTGDKSSSKVLLFLTDIFGHKFINSQLVADSYAAKGYYVLVPDLFKGDALESLNNGFPDGWLDRHSAENVEPIVKQVLEHIKTDIKPKYIASIGYCYGARLTIRLLGENAIDVGAVAHPSFVQLEEVAKIQKPLFISAAENDPIYTPELRAQTEAKLKEIKATYFTTLASGVSHGFAVRSDPKDKWAATQAKKTFDDSVWWFSLHE